MAVDLLNPTQINFGGNVVFSPVHCCTPADKDEVLDVLRRHARERIRCRGALHSWSRIAATDSVLLDLAELRQVRTSADGKSVRVGAGCTLERLLAELRSADRTLPALGVIKRQTAAGATSTGTHGSGTPSLSHFIAGATLACLDEAGQPRIVRVESGDELRAARCALGSMGVLLDLDLAVVPRYCVEESMCKADTLEKAAAGWSGGWPLTQFGLVPWAWTYIVYRRRVSQATGFWRRVQAWICWLWLTATNDFLLHFLLRGVLLSARLFSPSVIRCFFRFLPRMVMAGPSRVDDSESVLTMHHYWFRHVEMEVVIPESRLAMALPQLRELVEVAGGERAECSPPFRAALADAGLAAEVDGLRSAYTLHYPLFVRRIEADDTLVSMASPRGGDAGVSASIGIFSYGGVDDGYERFCRTVARCMMKLHGARLHWGKYFPVAPGEARAGYPRFEQFRAICRRYDPNGRFASEMLDDRA